MAAPVVRDVANSLKLDARRFLMPLSYVAVLGGCCTLIGTSTNLLVDDMARTSGQAPFTIFEITPVGLVVAVAGGLYLMLFSGHLLKSSPPAQEGPDPRRSARHHVSHVVSPVMPSATLAILPKIIILISPRHWHRSAFLSGSWR